jgi:hypothetical protein
MRIGVACGIFVDAVARLLERRRILAVAGHGVVFRVGGDDRLAFAERGAEGGRHGRRALFHLEALLAQQLHIPGGGSIFPPRWLMEAPYLLMALRQPVRLGLDPIQGGLLGRHQRGRTPIAGLGRMVIRHQGLRGIWRKGRDAGEFSRPAGAGRIKSADDEGVPALHDVVDVVHPPHGVEVDQLALDVGCGGQELESIR